MKKLLSMVMAMVLLCASMGVLATEGETDPNLVFYTGFEGETNSFTVIEKYTIDETVKITSSSSGAARIVSITDEADKEMFGNQCAEVSMNRSSGDDRMEFINTPLEAGKVYKFSFWFKYTGNSEAFSPKILGQVKSGSTVAGWFGVWNTSNSDIVIPKTAKDTWSYYEIYIPVQMGLNTPTLNIQFRTPFTANNADKFYYDEIRVEKVDGASLRFAEGSKFAMSNLASYATLDNANGLERATAATVSLDGENTATFYPFAVKSVAPNAATGSVPVFSHYIPQNTAETATLIAGVYKDVKGTPQLQNVFVKPCVYNEAIEAGIDYLDVDMSSYEGCYIKAFMLDGANMLKPMVDSEVLPAAAQ